MDDYRPDPDALLAAVQKDEARQRRGHLKIFFGMAAGVGKTYSMLETAQQVKADGRDVVVGYVETHGRIETAQLLDGFEIIPRRKIDYRGTVLEEMDTDAILVRNPELVLVDELAHTNADGSRHLKRYQDVIELLEAGIDVYTTVNVQHFESRADSVHQITGITVYETVPDTILDMADEIELIDLSPEELRKRLAEGKVYTADRVETAAKNFFRIGNLTALREMSLRLTAEHVDHQLQDYMQVKQIAGPWKSGERLLVAVGSSPFSEKLIRWTRRMAYNLEAPWLAVHVENTQPMLQVERERLAHHLSLARELGAEVLTVAGNNIPEALVRIAHQRNVTQIVVGKPLHSLFQTVLRGGSLVNNIIRLSGDIDIYVVNGDQPEKSKSRIVLPRFEQHSSWLQYAIAVFLVAMITAIDLALYPLISYLAAGLTELLVVLLIAVYLGRGPAVTAAFVSAISWNFLFITPRFTFEISQFQDIILFILYFAIAIFTGNLTARLRVQEQQSRYYAERNMALYTLAHETATAVSMEDVLRTAVQQIGQAFNAQVAILLAKNDRLERHPSSTLAMDDKAFSVAVWTFENGKPAGRFTDTLPLAAAQYLPLRTPSRIVGVIGVQTAQKERMSFDLYVLLEMFTNQVALTIERELLDEAAEQAAMLKESERLYGALLNSISHELRTPIAAVTGAAHSLLDIQTDSDSPIRVELLRDIQTSAERLNRLVENLLDMSRLDSGRLQLRRDWCDVGEIIGVTVQRLEKPLAQHPLTLELPPEQLLVRVDFVMIEQTLVNILDNACTYTPAGTPITIRVKVLPQRLLVMICDQGAGLPEEELARIFDKFYRVPGTVTGGTGLGLSIAKGLIEAHGGKLTVNKRTEGGLCFTIELPMNGNPTTVEEAKNEQ